MFFFYLRGVTLNWSMQFVATIVDNKDFGILRVIHLMISTITPSSVQLKTSVVHPDGIVLEFLPSWNSNKQIAGIPSTTCMPALVNNSISNWQWKRKLENVALFPYMHTRLRTQTSSMVQAQGTCSFEVNREHNSTTLQQATSN